MTTATHPRHKTLIKLTTKGTTKIVLECSRYKELNDVEEVDVNDDQYLLVAADGRTNNPHHCQIVNWTTELPEYFAAYQGDLRRFHKDHPWLDILGDRLARLAKAENTY